jgi:hypothetical protein
LDRDAPEEPSLSDVPKASLAAASESEIQITITKAGLVVPVEKAPSEFTSDPVAATVGDAGKEDTKAPAQEELPAKTPVAKKKNFISLKHYGGKQYMLPWAVCKTWKVR